MCTVLFVIHLPIVMTRSSAYRGQFRVEPFGSNMGSVSCWTTFSRARFFLCPPLPNCYAGYVWTRQNPKRTENEMRRDFELFNFPSTVYRWKRLPQATLFFFFFRFAYIWLRTEFKELEAGKLKKKKKEKKKKEMMKQKVTGNRDRED